MKFGLFVTLCAFCVILFLVFFQTNPENAMVLLSCPEDIILCNDRDRFFFPFGVQVLARPLEHSRIFSSPLRSAGLRLSLALLRCARLPNVCFSVSSVVRCFSAYLIRVLVVQSSSTPHPRNQSPIHSLLNVGVHSMLTRSLLPSGASLRDECCRT